MNENKKNLIKSLLDSDGQTGPEMVHNICKLGGGNMADGFVALYCSGQKNGIAIGAGSVIALVATYKIGKAVVEGVWVKKALRGYNVPHINVKPAPDISRFGSDEEISAEDEFNT